MIRPPTPEELAVINSWAPKEMKADECYVLEATPVNNMFKNSYGFTIGASSMYNFKNDLENTRIPLNIQHERHIPMGNWLPGQVVRVNPVPAGAIPGRDLTLMSNLYMPKGLTVEGGRCTDDVAMAYETGVMTDCSIAFHRGMLMCNICGNNYMSVRCEHLAGQAYDGIECVPDLQDAHLTFISLVDKGSVPGACCLTAGDKEINLVEGKMNWKAIKELPIDALLEGSLSMSINGIKGGNDNMKLTWEQAKEEFKAELEAEFATKSALEVAVQSVTHLSEQILVADGKVATLQTDHEKAVNDLSDITEKFATATADLEAYRQDAEIGKKYIESLQTEYHRLGVILHGEKWDNESEDTLLKAFATVAEKEKYLSGKIEQMKPEALKRFQKQEEELAEGKPVKKNQNPHLADSKNFKMKKDKK